jgi:hypothetical protein
MSGGNLNIYQPSTGSSGVYGIHIASSPANYNVTGGNITVYTNTVTGNTTNNSFFIDSTAPLFNLTVNTSNTTTQCYAGIINTPLVILGSLTLNNATAMSPIFVCNNKDLTIGGDFTSQSSTKFYTGTYSGTTLTTTGTGNIFFNGTSAQKWTYSSTSTVLSSNAVTINKTAGTTLTLAGNTLPNIATLTITSGGLADGGSTVTVTTGLSNRGVLSGTGKISYQSNPLGGTN